MRTKIIAAFPGTGKSYFVARFGQMARAIDLDTNDYTQGYDENGKVINQEFPDNYLSSIKGVIGQTNILFIGCQPEVLNLLRKEGIQATLIYPERQLKEEYASRFNKRGSSQAFNSRIYSNWDQFLDYLEAQDNERFVLGKGQHISDVITAS
ncbi:MAG TPA: hypothetical protein GXZ59_00065 [Clostridiaceae bacterium]|nr:hypothetical protein [Clostridiaceae bacterium]